MLPAVDLLRAVQMAESHIVEGFREDIGVDLSKGTDADVAHAVIFAHDAASGEEVAHRHYGKGGKGRGVGAGAGRFGAELFRPFRTAPVMLGHACGKQSVPVVHGVAGAGAEEVAVAQEGDGTDDELGAALTVAEKEDFFLGRARVADHMHVQCLKQGLGGVEEGGGIVVAGRDDDMAARAFGRFAEKAVVQRLCLIGGEAAVENIAGHKEHIHGFAAQGVRKPVEEKAEFIVAPAAVKGLPEMPVGSMEYVHGVSCMPVVARKKGAVIPRLRPFKRKDRNLLGRLRQRRRKRPAERQALSLCLLVDLGSHEADDDHDTKKSCNNGENGAVETSHVILLAFGTEFQK